MKYVLPSLLLLVVCWSIDGVAEERPYWLVGSFKNQYNANQERNRIVRGTNREVQIVPFDRDGERFHRLVIPVDGSLGLPGYDVDKLWVIWLDMADMRAASAPPGTASDSYLVAGSFGARDNAQAMLDDLQIMGGTLVTVRETEVNGTDFYRVLIGPLPDSASVDAAGRMLADEGISDAWMYEEAVKAVVPADTAPVLGPAAGDGQAPQTMVSMIPPVEDLSTASRTPARLARLTPRLMPRKTRLTYLEFCMTEANSAERRLYCLNDAFAEKSTTSQLKIPFEPGTTQMSYFEFCTKAANAMERKQYCSDADFDKRTALM